MTDSTWRLEQLCDVRSGGTPPRTEAEYYEGSIPWAKIDDLNVESGVVLETKENITTAGLAAIRGKLFEEGTILFAMYGSVGKKAWSGVRLATNQAILGIRVLDESKLDARFLWHWLDSKQTEFERDANGVTQKNLSAGYIRSLEIELPPLEDQQRIATILDKAGNLGRKRREAIRLSDEFLRSVFIDMFGSRPANDHAMQVRPLGDVCRFYAGNSLPFGEPFVGQAGGVLHIKVGDMNLPGNEVDINLAREWSTTASGGIIAPAGAILIPKRGGAIATNKKRVLRRPCALDPNLMAIAPGEELRQEVLLEWFKQFDLTSISSGSAVPQLNKGDLAPLKMPVPPLEMQDEFVKVARRVKAMLTRQSEQLILIQQASAALTSDLLGA